MRLTKLRASNKRDIQQHNVCQGQVQICRRDLNTCSATHKYFSASVTSRLLQTFPMIPALCLLRMKGELCNSLMGCASAGAVLLQCLLLTTAIQRSQVIGVKPNADRDVHLLPGTFQVWHTHRYHALFVITQPLRRKSAVLWAFQETHLEGFFFIDGAQACFMDYQINGFVLQMQYQSLLRKIGPWCSRTCGSIMLMSQSFSQYRFSFFLMCQHWKTFRNRGEIVDEFLGIWLGHRCISKQIWIYVKFDVPQVILLVEHAKDKDLCM